MNWWNKKNLKEYVLSEIFKERLAQEAKASRYSEDDQPHSEAQAEREDEATRDNAEQKSTKHS